MERKMSAKGAWENTFPGQQETKEDSSSFVKRLLYIGFSQVIMARKLLPFNCFKKRYIGRVRIMTFDPKNDDCTLTMNQLRGAVEAVELGYLRELHLIIKDRKNEKVIEVYKVAVTYDNDVAGLVFSADTMDAVSIDYKGADFVRQETQEFIIRLRRITDALAELPEDSTWTFYITYRDEPTPKGYQARGFRREPNPYTLADEIQGVDVGAVHTKLHAVYMQTKSCFISDSVEFEARITGEYEDIANILGRGDSTLDSTITDHNGSPSRELSINPGRVQAAGPEPVAESAQQEERKNSGGHSAAEVKGSRTRGGRAKGGSQVPALEKATEALNLVDGVGPNPSSPEERENDLAQDKVGLALRRKKEDSRSPKRVTAVGRVMKRTPGLADSKSRSRGHSTRG